MAEVTHNDLPPATVESEAEAHHDLDDTVTLFRRSFELPGGIYTFIFVVLAILTILEVAIAEIFQETFVTIIILLALSIAKIALVVLYYMHLRTDSRIFAVIFLVPMIMATLAIFFLLAVPIETSYIPIPAP